MAKRIIRDHLKGSEFGGVDGLVQPAPHDWTNRPREVLIAIHQRETLTQPGVENLNGDMRGELLPPSTDQYRGRVPLPEPQEVILAEKLADMMIAMAQAVEAAMAEGEDSDESPVQA